MGDHSIKFTRYLILMLAIVVALAVSLAALLFEQRRYQDAVSNREHSIRLVEELRQSSTDLAKLANNYINTLEPVYKELFLELVAIRNGDMPRPKHYNLAYWDLHVSNHYDEGEEFDRATPLLTLLRQSGLTDNEWSLVEKAKQNSDSLVQIELKAMSLVEEDFPVNLKKRDLALAMLADDYFINAKADIMKPIISAEEMIISRTQKYVDAAKSNVRVVTFVVAALCLALVFLITLVGRQLQRILGCSVTELQSTIERLGKGDFLTTIKLEEHNKDSVLGWLASTQQRLADLNLAHFRAIVDCSDDAIISKSIHGVISSWNRGAELVFGYSAEEMIGRPMMEIIPAERQHEEPEILKKISCGEKVDHFETQRCHKNGHLVDVSVTISPIYDLNGKVIGASKIARDISRAKAAEQEIHRLAYYDALTGLANRRLLYSSLASACAHVKHTQQELALVFIDLDNFKPLNDQKGHEAGDQLLKQVAERLNGLIRGSDLAARFGGDEFILVLYGPTERRAADHYWLDSLLQRIMESLGQPYQFDGFEHCCSPSVGVSLLHGDMDFETLIQLADEAMYQAKSLGKNQYVIHVPEAVGQSI